MERPTEEYLKFMTEMNLADEVDLELIRVKVFGKTIADINNSIDSMQGAVDSACEYLCGEKASE